MSVDRIPLADSQYLDANSVTTTAGAALREVVNIASPTDPLGIAGVSDLGPVFGSYGLFTRNLDFDLAVTSGKVPGVTQFRKYGHTEVAAGTPTAIIRLGEIQMPSTATKVELFTSGNDIAAGSGARSVTIWGTKDDWTEATETIACPAVAGASAASVNSYYRVYRAEVATCGTYQTLANTTRTNENDLNVRAVGAGVTFLQIYRGRGATASSHYCVPAGYYLIVRDVKFFVDQSKPCNLEVFYRLNANTTTAPFSPAICLIEMDGATNDFQYKYDPPVILPPYTDVWFRAQKVGGGADGNVSVEYSGYLAAASAFA